MPGQPGISRANAVNHGQAYIVHIPEDINPQEFLEKFAVMPDKEGLYVFDSVPTLPTYEPKVVKPRSQNGHKTRKLRVPFHDSKMDGPTSPTGPPRISTLDFEHPNDIRPQIDLSSPPLEQNSREREAEIDISDATPVTHRSEDDYEIVDVHNTADKPGKHNLSSTFRHPHTKHHRRSRIQLSRRKHSRRKGSRTLSEELASQYEEDFARYIDLHAPRTATPRSPRPPRRTQRSSRRVLESIGTGTDLENPCKYSRNRARTKPELDKPPKRNWQRNGARRVEAETDGNKHAPLGPVEQVRLNGRLGDGDCDWDLPHQVSSRRNYNRGRRRYNDSVASESGTSIPDSREGWI